METCGTGTGQCVGGVVPCVDAACCDEATDVCLECLDATECNPWSTPVFRLGDYLRCDWIGIGGAKGVVTEPEKCESPLL